MNNDLIEKITSLTNLYWAWEKAKWFFKPGDIWFDEIEVKEFEADISNELKGIQKDILAGSYQMSPIKPVAFPKTKGEDGSPRTRQTFWISVRDQVTWLAVTNVIGGLIDYKMPFWSYGNRLYISTFYEDNEATDKRELKFGFYRNTSRYTYRKWIQSWPLYRRHICLTSKFLTGNLKEIEFDELDKEALDINNSLSNKHPLKVEYLDPDYWANNRGNLFWAGLDLEKFYPNVRITSIKRNLLKYLNDQSSLLVTLIDKLLDFQIDFSGWDENELEKIQLEINFRPYDNIPTGLFVGGFLANVALLEVDKEITRKLTKNKNIAHFRYVDDHVIISNTFEGLIEWIESYDSLLKESSVFVNNPINASKTEPSSLGEYFKYKEDVERNNESLLKYYDKAKKECEVDPEFPSPLMTQTLTKVSKIAGTEFQLLDPEEQKGLISDIEHLLVTEFPDNELRRDTRISFAASMLTSLVPQLSVDQSKEYELSRQLFIMKQKVEGGKNIIEIDYNKKLSLKKEISSIEGKLKAQQSRTEQEEKKLLFRTIKLLKKAVRENHQKVRLWTRLVEFSYKSGGQIEKQIFDEINRLIINNESNELSITYVRSLVLQVVTNQLINAYRIILNQSALYKSKERASMFLDGILTNELLEEVSEIFKTNLKFYEKNSLDAFKFTLGTVIHLSRDIISKTENNQRHILIDRHGLINWNQNPRDFCNKTSHSFESWVWWFLSKVTVLDERTPPKIWDIAINKIEIFNNVGQALISLYPRYLPEKIIRSIDEKFKESSAFHVEGWIYDVNIGMKERGLNVSANFLNQIRKKEFPYKKDITIDDWISWTNSRQGKSLEGGVEIFDPRLGEWMALEIIRQIAEEVLERIEQIRFDFNNRTLDQNEDYFRAIHPKNFKITKELILPDKLSWEALRNILNDSNGIEFIARENLIHDSRFYSILPQETSYRRKIESVLGSLGAILVCLLSKRIDFPSKWNPEGHQFMWLSLMNSMLWEVPVSSYTRDIILGCFSKRNIETRQLIKDRNELGFDAEDDFKKDPPLFITIRDFVDYVSLSQKFLEKQQMSVSENQPRQLIPISLIQITNSQYHKLIEEID